MSHQLKVSVLARINAKVKRKFNSSLRVVFPLFEKWGIHVLPVSFYSPIPELKSLDPGLFQKVSRCPGLDWRIEKQKEILKREIARYSNEKTFPRNEGLNVHDAAVLHALIRSRKPKRLIEIGAGQSTLFILDALKRNQADGFECHFTSIEPFLNAHLRSLFPPSLELLEKKVQEVDPAFFEDCDLLFIDSSHVAKIGSDVLHEFLEIIPRMKVGALIHFHDILIPGEYWPDWIKGLHFFWNEQYFLQAFLLFNSSFKVLWGSRYMQLNAIAELKEVFPQLSEHDHISSFWIERIS